MLNGIHPMVVHFPVALLLTAPVLLVIAAVLKGHRSWMLAGLVVMTLGTAGAWAAVATGEADGELAERALPGVKAVLEQHEQMAETTSTIFTVLALVLAALIAIPWVFKKQLSTAMKVAPLAVFLALYAGAAGYLASTAHQGGRLVHELGVRTMMAPTTGAPAAAPAGEAGAKGGDGDGDGD